MNPKNIHIGNLIDPIIIRVGYSRDPKIIQIRNLMENNNFRNGTFMEPQIIQIGNLVDTKINPFRIIWHNRIIEIVWYWHITKPRHRTCSNWNQHEPNQRGKLVQSMMWRIYSWQHFGNRCGENGRKQTRYSICCNSDRDGVECHWILTMSEFVWSQIQLFPTLPSPSIQFGPHVHWVCSRGRRSTKCQHS